MNQPEKFLIVRTDRIGDVVLSLPIASVIKEHYPNAKISFLLKEYSSSLAQNCSAIDEVLILRESGGKELIKENIPLLKNKFDVAIVAYPTFKIALILWLASVKIRIGSGYRLYSFLFNRKVYEHRKHGNKHEAEHNVTLLRSIGIDKKIDAGKVNFGLSADTDSKNRIKDFLQKQNVDLGNKIIIVHPGSGGSAIDLPIAKMKLLVEKICSINNVVLIITGSEHEKELCNQMVVSPAIINASGMFNLKDLIALIDYSHILIANSTGPIHIAAALGKNVIGFYPKFDAVNPKRWGPFTNKAVIFQPEICSGICSKEKCHKLNCMNSIDIKKVFNSIQTILSKQ